MRTGCYKKNSGKNSRKLKSRITNTRSTIIRLDYKAERITRWKMEMKKMKDSAQETQRRKGRGTKTRKGQREVTKKITQENGESPVTEGNASPAQRVSTATSHARREGAPTSRRETVPVWPRRPGSGLARPPPARTCDPTASVTHILLR